MTYTLECLLAFVMVTNKTSKKISNFLSNRLISALNLMLYFLSQKLCFIIFFFNYIFRVKYFFSSLGKSQLHRSEIKIELEKKNNIQIKTNAAVKLRKRRKNLSHCAGSYSNNTHSQAVYFFVSFNTERASVIYGAHTRGFFARKKL